MRDESAVHQSWYAHQKDEVRVALLLSFNEAIVEEVF